MTERQRSVFAVAAFSVSARTMPNEPNETPNDWKARGVRLRESGQYDDAVQAFRQALQQSSDESDLWFELAYSLSEIPQPAEAIKAYREGIALDAENSWAWNNLGWCYASVGQAEQAAKCHRRAVTISPENLYGWQRLAEYYESTGDAPQRLLALNQVAAIQGDYGAWNSFGIECWKSGHKERAIDAYLRAASLDPEQAAAYFNLGLAYSKLGQIRKAAAGFQEALRVNPSHEEACSQMHALQPQLRQIVGHIRDFETNRKAKYPPYGGYLNPFELLNLDEDTADTTTIRGARKKLLHELELCDGTVSWLGDARLDFARVIQTLEELDEPRKRELHASVFQDRTLLRLLTHGDLTYFGVHHETCAQFGLSIFDMDPHGDVCGKWFCRQVGRALRDAVAANDDIVVSTLSESLFNCAGSQLDDCFRLVSEYLRQLASDISAFPVQSRDDAPRLLTLVHSRLPVPTLNALPPYFEDLRTSLVHAIREQAITCHNEYEEPAM